MVKGRKTLSNNKSAFSCLGNQAFGLLCNENRQVSGHIYSLRSKTESLNSHAICAYAVNTIFDYWFCRYEFPNINKDNKPYKSSDGIMSFSPEVGVEIPDGWEVLMFAMFY